MVERFGYEVEGWGVGELWLEGSTLAWHELPWARPPAPDVHPLAK